MKVKNATFLLRFLGVFIAIFLFGQSAYAQITWYRDVDNDGFGAIGTDSIDIVQPAGYVANNTDCAVNDINKWRNKTVYKDVDGDNYYVGTAVQCYGIAPSGNYIDSALVKGVDCNDNSVLIYKSLAVFIDVDSDFYKIKDTTLCLGVGVNGLYPSKYKTDSVRGVDCDDNNILILGADTSAYIDNDQDGFGVGSLTLFCRNKPGWSGFPGDCNDNNPAIKLPDFTYFRDFDGDLKGDKNVVLPGCPGLTPTGYVTDSTDCNDSDVTAYILDSIYIDFDADTFTLGKDLVCHGIIPVAGYSYTSNGSDCDDNHSTAWRSPVVYVDADDDNYDAGTDSAQCFGVSVPAGFKLTTLGSDCNDADTFSTVLRPLYRDYDGDGYHGRVDSVCYGLTFPLYYSDSTLGLDCKDSSATEFPGQVWHPDADGDGFGDANVSLVACAQPEGYGLNIGDCNDNDSTKYRLGVFFEDQDGDFIYKRIVTICYGVLVPLGYADTTGNTGLYVGVDCNDTLYFDQILAPNAGLPSNLMFVDADGDGFGTGTASYYCNVDTGYSFIGGDCSDAFAYIDTTRTIFYQDKDGDFFGNNDSTILACSPPNGYVISPSDCDDTDANQFPGQKWFEDLDGDSYGNVLDFRVNCSPVGSYTALDSTDCNVFNNTRWRIVTAYIDLDGDNYDDGNAVLCIGNLVPGGYSAFTLGTDCNDGFVFEYRLDSFYRDADADGYDVGYEEVCYGLLSPPSGYAASTTGFDCDDADTAVTAPTLVYFLDADGDAYGAGASSLYCTDPGVGFSLVGTDCNDADNLVYTGALLYEDLDLDGYHGDTATFCYGATLPTGYFASTLGVDCNDNADSLFASTLLYTDIDLDQYSAGQATLCIGATIPLGYDTVSLGTDCNDNDPNKWRSQQLFIDNDNDGYTAGQSVVCYGASVPTGYKLTSLGVDCNDNNVAINPGATEIPKNNVDENCDGLDWWVGIDNVEVAVAKVYPNPGNNIATLQLSSDWSSTLEVTVRDIEGRVVSVQNLNAELGTATLNTQELSSGMYVFVISDSRNTASVRWMKN
jgi:hypothetical protein